MALRADFNLGTEVNSGQADSFTNTVCCSGSM